MKKIVSLIILILMICIVPFPGIVAFAEGEVSNADNTEWIKADFLNEFATGYSNRLAGTKGEQNAAAFIAGKFQKFVDDAGYIPYPDALEADKNAAEEYKKFYQKFDFTNNEVINYSQNIIMVKPAFSQNKNTKTVVIGAHYDNYYVVPQGVNESDYNMQGAYDNGTGITVLLDLAERFKNENFDFNIEFVAFGAEEYSLAGSTHYVDKLTEAKLNNILIMFNLDVIGAGDKLYLYCDEVETGHEKFLFDIAKAQGIEIKSAPLDKHVALSAIDDMPYSHTGLMSDNLPFLTEGLNTAFFFTYNWEYGLSESTKYPSMMHNTNDNMEVLNERYAATYEKFMTDVSDIIFTSLKSDGFEEKMIASLNTKFDYRPFMDKTMIIIVCVAVLTLAAILIILTYFMLNKNKVTPAPEVVDANPFEENGGNDDTVFGKDFEDGDFN